MFDNTDAESFFGEDYDFDKTKITDSNAIDAFINELLTGDETCVRQQKRNDGTIVTTYAARKKHASMEDYYRIADIKVITDPDGTRWAEEAFTGDDGEKESREFMNG